jgi:hypothetical protein
MDPNKYCQPPPPINGGEIMVQTPTGATNKKAQLNSGNYINVVPMSVVGQYHHRRKYSPQILPDYQ